jgi:DedD protein
LNMIESNATNGTVSSVPHSVPELEQIAAAERELKRRGRRRLIGAGTLGLLGVIFLPMFFDTEPRGEKTRSGGAGNTKEINITIPQREGLSALPPPAAPVTPLIAPSVTPPLDALTKPASDVSALSPAKAESAEPKILGTATALGAVAVGTAVVGAASIVNSKASAEKSVPKSPVEQPTVKSAPSTAIVTPPPLAPTKPVEKPIAVPAAPSPAASVGVAKVVSPNPTAVPAPPAQLAASVPATGGFVVQLGAFSDDYNIRTLTERMKSGKLPVYAEKIQITSAGKPKTVTRLRVGPYPTMEKAKLISAKVKALGVTNSVVAK